MKKNKFQVKSLLLFLAIAILLSAKIVSAHEWMAPKDAAKLKNPESPTLESVQQGKELFIINCAYCHGEKASGMSADEAGLKTSSPNLVKRLSNHTDGDFFWKIQHGRGEMPPFKDDLQDADIWNIINFIKSIKDSE